MRALVVVLLGALTMPAVARADRPFSQRFSANTQGEITIAASNIMTCVTSEPVCPAARAGTLAPVAQANNNSRVMTYVDTDGDATTFNSSQADLVLPAGARVLFAGLYYGGRVAAGSGGRAALNPAARGTVLLQAPGDTSYRTLSGAPFDTAGETYQAFHDVTGIVAATGAGSYRVANVQAGTGRSDGQLGGWALVVAYGDPAAPSRNLSVFDGLQNVSSSSPGVTIPLSGFVTPTSGPVNSTVGLIAYEGDLGTSGDGATILGATGPRALGGGTPGPPPLNATNNLFDSSISARGPTVTTRAPADRNTLGYDADLFALPGVLGNSQSSTEVRLTTAGDAYQPGVVTIATDLFAPRIVATKAVSAAAADPGGALTYTLNVSNTGQDGAEDVEISDTIPANTTYVPGSLTIDGIAQSDATDGDQGELAGSRIVARVGAGATGTTGGTLAPGAPARTVSFQVRIDTVVPPSTVITNAARVGFVTQTTDERDAGVETAPAETAVRSPTVNLVVTKEEVSTPDPTKSPTSAYPPDDPIVFRVTVTNQGSLPAPSVVLTDVLPAPMSSLGAFIEPSGPFCPPGELTVCDLGTLQPGETRAVQFAGVLPNDVTIFPPAATLTNRVVATSGGTETNPTDNEATASVETLPVTEVSVRKSFAPAEPLAGGSVTYTMVVRSNGPSVADVFFGDLLPAALQNPSISIAGGTGDCSFGELPEAPGVPLGLCVIPQMEIGGERVITLTGTLAPDSAGNTVLNRAAVTPNGLEADNQRADDVSEVSFVPRRVDLTLTKTRVETGPVMAGGETTFRLRVTNTGDGTATNVVVRDTLPAALTPLDTPAACETSGQLVTCHAADLAAGEERTFELRTRAEEAAAGTTLTNSAEATTDSPDLDGANDAAQVPVPVATLPPAQAGAPPPPAPVQVVTACRSLRHFTIRLRERRTRVVRSAEVRVAGRRVVTMRRRSDRRLVADIDLRGLPAGTHRVEITARLRDGRRFRWVRSYRTCTTRLPPSNRLEDPDAF